MFSFEEFCRKIYCVGLLGLLISLVGSSILDINKKPYTPVTSLIFKNHILMIRSIMSLRYEMSFENVVINQ